MEKILVRKLNHANLHVQCDSGTAQELREFFSFYVPGYRFMPAYKNRMWDGKIRLYDAKTGELPAGLFYHLHKFSKSRGYIVDTEKTKYGLPNENANVDLKQLTNYIDDLGLPFRPYSYQLSGIQEGLKRKRAI